MQCSHKSAVIPGGLDCDGSLLPEPLPLTPAWLFSLPPLLARLRHACTLELPMCLHDKLRPRAEGHKEKGNMPVQIDSCFKVLWNHFVTSCILSTVLEIVLLFNYSLLMLHAHQGCGFMFDTTFFRSDSSMSIHDWVLTNTKQHTTNNYETSDIISHNER